MSIIEPGNYIAGTNIFTKETVGNLADNMWNKMSDVVKKDYGREYFDAKVNLELCYLCVGLLCNDIYK